MGLRVVQAGIVISYTLFENTETTIMFVIIQVLLHLKHKQTNYLKFVTLFELLNISGVIEEQ